MSATMEADKTHHREEPMKVSHSSRSLPKSSVMANNRFFFVRVLSDIPPKETEASATSKIAENVSKRKHRTTSGVLRFPDVRGRKGLAKKEALLFRRALKS